MRKILPYILIFVIFVQLFAPFTVGTGVKNNVEIQANKAEADYDFSESGITLKSTSEVTKESIKLNVDVIWGTSPTIALSDEAIIVTIMSGDEKVRAKEITNLDPSGNNNQSGSVFFDGLEANTEYKIILTATQRSQTLFEAINNWRIILLGLDDIGEWTNLDNLPFGIGDFLFKPDESSGTVTNFENPYLITTLTSDDSSTQTQTLDSLKNEAAMLPLCELMESSTWGGCIGLVLYKLIFKPSAYIFAITGKLLDYTFFYTIQDTSYRSQFVVEGWGIVRDFCNMFFIFILLYIAIGTILNLHSVKPKEMIINVVIIGLLINFSLFATQVIIDASNILARVFYNQILVGDKDKNTNEINEELGFGGSKQLTVALVNKINPQKILMNAEKGSSITGKGIITSDPNQPTNGVDSGTFIMVVILASIMNIVGLYVFFMVSLVFIARVIGLWLAMVVVPMTFFSYAVPQMQDIEMIGWKKWWPDTLKMAFLAPVFIMFLYLIIMFLSSGMGVLDANNKEGIDFFIAIIVPFAFLMILLLKAKDITKKMSGTIGQSITNGVAAVGGIALGGAALGGALIGRKVIGAGLARISRSDDAMHRATHKVAFSKEVSEWKAKGSIGPKPKFEDYLARTGTTVKGGLLTRLGSKLNEKQMKIGDVDHARHEMDETKKAAGLEGVDDSNLSGVNEKKLKDTFAKTKKSETEADVRKGFDGKGKPILLDGKYQGEEAYKSANRGALVDEAKKDTKNMIKDASGNITGELTDEAKKKVENELNVKLNAAVKLVTDDKLVKDFEKIRKESKQSVGGVERAFSRTNTGSWDVRKLSDIKSDKREGIMTKIPVALIAGVATGVRAGIKNVGLSNGGVKVEGDFLKDLGNTISDSLKSLKVNVDLSHVGETKSSADAHGGGHH